MTIKEKLETIKGKKIAIWCFDEYEARILVKYICGYVEGKEDAVNDYFGWVGTHSCLEYTDSYKFKFNFRGKYREEGYEVIYFDEFIKDTDLNLKNSLNIILPMDYVQTILNDKYGKDNWVIK